MTGISDNRPVSPVVENLVLVLFFYLAEWSIQQGISADTRLQVQNWILGPLLLLLALEAPALQQLIGMEFGYFQKRFPEKVWPVNSKNKYWITWGISAAFIRTIFRVVLLIDPAVKVLKISFPQVANAVWMWAYILVLLYLLWSELKLFVFLGAPDMARSSPKWYWHARLVVLAILAMNMYAFTHGFGSMLRFSTRESAGWFFMLFTFGFFFLPLRMVEFKLAWVNGCNAVQRIMLVVSNFILMSKMCGMF